MPCATLLSGNLSLSPSVINEINIYPITSSVMDKDMSNPVLVGGWGVVKKGTRQNVAGREFPPTAFRREASPIHNNMHNYNVNMSMLPMPITSFEYYLQPFRIPLSIV